MAQEYGSSSSLYLGVVCLAISKIFLWFHIETVSDLAAILAIVGFGLNVFINWPRIKDRIFDIYKKLKQ